MHICVVFVEISFESNIPDPVHLVELWRSPKSTVRIPCMETARKYQCFVFPLDQGWDREAQAHLGITHTPEETFAHTC